MTTGNSENAESVTAIFHRSLELLFTRRFGTFFFATLLSNLGTWAQLIAEPWLLLSIGASSFLIGVDSFALNAPAFALILVGGVLADRSDRRSIIALFQSIQMLCPTVLVVLLLTGSVHPWVVIALSAVVGITDALSMPAFQSIVPSLVAREQIASGITLNSMQFNLSRILGPALAGILMASFGPVACFAVNALSYLPFIGVALWILPRRAPNAPTPPPFERRALWDGIQSIVHRPDIRTPLLTVMITSLFCAPLVTFIPVLVRDALSGNIGGFSTAVTAFGIGGVFGAILLLGIEASVRRKLISVLALLYGAITALVGASPSLWVLHGLLFAGGAAMTASNIAANSQVQTAAPPTLRGQSVSLYMLALRGGLALGSLLTGGLVHIVGIRYALMTDGVLAIAAQSLLIWGAARNTAAAS